MLFSRPDSTLIPHLTNLFIPSLSVTLDKLSHVLSQNPFTTWPPGHWSHLVPHQLRLLRVCSSPGTLHVGSVSGFGPQTLLYSDYLDDFPVLWFQVYLLICPQFIFGYRDLFTLWNFTWQNTYDSCTLSFDLDFKVFFFFLKRKKAKKEKRGKKLLWHTP